MSDAFGCPAIGTGGRHSESYGEDGTGACTACGERPIPRYCPLEVPPDLCYRGCGMGACELVMAVSAAPQNPSSHCGRCGDVLEACGCSPEALSAFMASIARGDDIEHVCYSCSTPLDYTPTAQPALCRDCENIP